MPHIFDATICSLSLALGADEVTLLRTVELVHLHYSPAATPMTARCCKEALLASSPPDPPPRPFLFPRWTNQLREISALVGVFGLVYAVIVVGWTFSPETSAIGYEPDQPVPYSHRLHAGELGIDCRYCHNTVEKTARASLPPAATCMNCHSTIRTQSEALAPVRAAYEDGEPLRWVRIHDLPDFVYFNHSAHLNAGIGCVHCHGRVDRMEVVSQRKPLTMGWCLGCHRNPRPFLGPRSETTNLAWAPDQGSFDPEALIAAYDLTPSTDCSTCHR